MESFSEDSFLWTDTSSESREDTMAEKIYKRHSSFKSTSNEDHHDNMSCEDLQENILDVKVKKETDYKKRSKIKIEPESDVDVPARKKRKSKTHYGSESTAAVDEEYLERKVKEEIASESSPQIHSHKKKKNKVHSDDQKEKNDFNKAEVLSYETHNISNTKCNDCSGEDISGAPTQVQDSEADSYSKPKKKKKKKSKRKYSSDDNLADAIGEDKFTAEETVIGNQLSSDEADLRAQNKKMNGTVNRIEMMQEGSDDISYDEISAIKGDDDHNLHSTLFDTKNSKRKNRTSDCDKTSDDESFPKLVENMQRTPKISDRIQFEDEDDSNGENNLNISDHRTKKPINTISSKVNHHLRINNYLKPLTQHIHSSSILTKDDEIWVLKCPREIEIATFNNINFNLDGKCKIKISGQAYEAVTKQEGSMITVLSMDSNKYQLKNLPVSGTISLRKRIPKPHYLEDNIIVNQQTNFIPLPQTKCRHPLFGSNYKKALKIPSKIAARLNAQDDKQLSGNPEKKKKKHKKYKNKAIEPYSECNAEFDEKPLKAEPAFTSGVADTRKKKRRHTDDEGPAPKKKRIKHDPESTDAWGSEKAIEENLFNF